MPSQQTITIVKATAPVLEEHGEALTRHFYTRMFAHNPEVAPYFNAANQTAGRQQKALAAAIAASMMCSGVLKSGSPMLRSMTSMPWDFIFLACEEIAMLGDEGKFSTF